MLQQNNRLKHKTKSTRKGFSEQHFDSLTKRVKGCSENRKKDGCVSKGKLLRY